LEQGHYKLHAGPFFESYILGHLSLGPAGLPLFFVSAAATAGGEPDQSRSRPDRTKSFVSAQATQRVYIVQTTVSIHQMTSCLLFFSRMCHETCFSLRGSRSNIQTL
jgi:hypothetical protein